MIWRLVAANHLVSGNNGDRQNRLSAATADHESLRHAEQQAQSSLISRRVRPAGRRGGATVVRFGLARCGTTKMGGQIASSARRQGCRNTPVCGIRRRHRDWGDLVRPSFVPEPQHTYERSAPAPVMCATG